MRTAIQDGPDFYLFGGDDEPEQTIVSPFRFKDGDITEAQKARQWFQKHYPDIEVIDA